MALLEVDNVTVGYEGGPDILVGLSMSFERNTTYCIIGPNGAGKSTLLRVICGLLHPRRGNVVFDGDSLNRLRPDEILAKGICFVPQDQSLFPEMTVTENLRMGGYILKDRQLVEERIESAFRMFPMLDERRSQMANTLSGGEQQMLAMGRALVLNPEILMLDEPSLGLAPMVSRQIFDNIEQLEPVVRGSSEGRGKAWPIRACFYFSSILYPPFLPQDAGRICVLDLGKTLFEGPSETILDDPRIQEAYLGRKRPKRPVVGE